jgi:ribosomal protein S27AE
MNYDLLRVGERLLLTRFYCSICGLVPFYYLDLLHLNRVRCGKCSSFIVLRNSGKYGKIRKRIAIKSCRAIDEMLNSN